MRRFPSAEAIQLVKPFDAPKFVAMSRAFTREEDSENAIADIGERPISPHRNLVTQHGLAMIEAEIADLRANLAKAEAEGGPRAHRA